MDTRSSVEIPTSTLIVGLILIGVVAYFVFRNTGNQRNQIAGVQSMSPPSGQYKNLETWDVSYNDDGLPTKISIHRDATRTPAVSQSIRVSRLPEGMQ